jgi:allantoinase
MARYDLIVRGAAVARHDDPEPKVADIGIVGGRIAAVGELAGSDADDSLDASGLVAVPGVVDAHQHWGIYNPIEVDAVVESRACAQGGVTTSINYMRTGQYYLNRSGPYRTFFPEVLERTQGRPLVDYAFHLAPMMQQHIDEIPSIIDDFGVTSFKIFMFYGSHGLHGRSADQSSFLMTPPEEHYNLAHFEFIMRAVEAARRDRPALADRISLSLHCETPEIMTAYTKLVEEAGELKGLPAYSASRPQHSEGLAVTIASYLAYETGLANINLLHLSSEKAIDAAMKMAAAFPAVDFRREVTIGHLLADCDSAVGVGGKVNPPLRPRRDVEALWEHVLAGDVSWVASDHACCRDEVKFGDPRDDVFLAKSGFGGTEYLLAGLISEGRRRGLGYDAVARMLSWEPARRFGLDRKGAIAEGFDADIALVENDAPWVVHAADSRSAQEYTPFENMTLEARVLHTLLRGEPVLRDAKVVGAPRGRYLDRAHPKPEAQTQEGTLP